VTDRADAGSFPLGERLVAHLAARRPDLKAVVARAESPRTLLSLLKTRQLDLALLRAEDAHLGLRGHDPYSDLAVPLRALAVVAAEYLYPMVVTSSPIQAIADLKGRRVGVVENGGRARLKIQRLATASGLDAESDIRWHGPAADEATAALGRDAIDALVLETPAPAPAMALPSAPDPGLRLVPHGDAVVALIARHGPIYFPATPSGDAAPTTAAPGRVLGELRLLVCREDHPVERARAIAEALEGWSGPAPADAPLPIPFHAAVQPAPTRP
jgi:uncharacterized protein